jgi:hypothetical protein
VVIGVGLAVVTVMIVVTVVTMVTLMTSGDIDGSGTLILPSKKASTAVIDSFFLCMCERVGFMRNWFWRTQVITGLHSIRQLKQFTIFSDFMGQTHHMMNSILRLF